MSADLQVAVITGAASGIGFGMASAFAEGGMRVVLSDVRPDELDRAVTVLTEQGHDVIGVHTDVSVHTDVESLAAATLQRFGRVDVLCNNAGVSTLERIVNLSIADWAWTIGIDLWGPIHGVSVFLPIMESQGFGHINSTSSVGGLVANRGTAPYNVSKAGVISLMATLERELRAVQSPVRASVLCPGPVKTALATSSTVLDSAQRAGSDRERSDEANHIQSKMGEGLATHGMDPRQVGQLVFDAVRDQNFWVLTHPELIQHLQAEIDAMLEDRSLPRLRML